MGLNATLKTLDPHAEGLLVLDDEDVNQIHEVLLDMVRDIAEICEANQIEWSLSGGSILGAVRHKGFIPWDDDIDINMTRKNFERFRAVFPGKYQGKYDLKIPGDPGYLFHFPKIFKKDTKFREILSKEDGFNGLYVDIFIMENTPDNALLRGLHGLACTALLLILSARRVWECRDTFVKYSRKNPGLRKELKRRLFLGGCFRFFSMERWLRIASRCFSRVKNETTKHIVIPSGGAHYFGEIFERDKVCNFVSVPFETEQWPVPADTSYYLSKRYGEDYMTPPPKEKQEKHTLIEFDLGRKESHGPHQQTCVMRRKEGADESEKSI